MVAQATTPVVVDGALTDAAWTAAIATEGFVQSEPFTGQPATERTTVRMLCDGAALFIGAMCHDSDAASLVAKDLRKDFALTGQDTFEVVIDSFGDKRNGFLFATTPAGARADQQITNEGRDINASWDGVWTVRTQRTAEGWTVEMAIPLTALRFEPGGEWGINFSRRIRCKNEIDYWSPVPRSFSLARVSLAGQLLGLSDARPGRNLQIKPYVLAGAVRALGDSAYNSTSHIGLDVKYAVTPALTLDVTVRPDFAQAEADEQQVNLTQFSQFFPEKRSFFLENAGLFYVGDAARNRMNPTPTPDEDLLLFFSRRIGLSPSGSAVPILAGARLTGRAGGFAIGALTVQTESAPASPATNYSVLRLRRNLFGASDVGVIVMSRQNTADTADYNRVFGADANIRLYRILDWSSYVMRSVTPGVQDDQYAARTSLNWEGPFFHGKAGLLVIGRGFRDDLAYYRRTGVRKYLVDTGLRPRPAWLNRVGLRELHPHVAWNWYTDSSNRAIARTLHSGMTFLRKSGAYVELSHNAQMQALMQPLQFPTATVALAPGDYSWAEWRLLTQSDASRTFSGTATINWGRLWNGTQRSVATATVQPSAQWRMTVGLQRTSGKLLLPGQCIVSSLVTMRTNYSFTTNMFLDALVQYNRDRRQINTNIRFNFIHRPLSDLYVVYNEQRFTTDGARGGTRRDCEVQSDVSVLSLTARDTFIRNRLEALAKSSSRRSRSNWARSKPHAGSTTVGVRRSRTSARDARHGLKPVPSGRFPLRRIGNRS